ncbi:MAG TPA: glutathione S-transferase [Candidatus Competibacteraceae bacterium]|nr:glutathione S-transferase [Candidatus Competibacteraceae bacterium]
MDLYQFPISHFCEKARWALDYKGIPWRARNLLPGPHLRTTRRLARDSSVPLLVDGERVIQGSSAIIDYLEQQRPEPALTPRTGNLASLAREWEIFLDQEIGIHLRRYFFHYWLAEPELLRPLLLQGASGPGVLLYRLGFSQVRRLMRSSMNITPETAELSRQRVLAALRRLDAVVARQPFVVAGGFSRADLTAAALLGPLCRAEGYGIVWPQRLPAVLAEFHEAQARRPFYAWVTGLYRDYRHPTRT